MKSVLTFLFSILLVFFSTAQDDSTLKAASCPTYDYPTYGAINFKNTQYGFKLYKVGGVTKKIAYGINLNLQDINYVPQYNTDIPPKPIDEICNDKVVTETNCILDLNNTLVYVVYYPTTTVNGTTYNLGSCKLPAIILFHAGGFSDCKADIDANTGGPAVIAQEFAKRGYVAFVVEYRTGRYLAPPYAKNQSFLSAQQSLASYRAFQDARGAIRSIITHQQVRDKGQQFQNEPYQIALDKIFIGGNSAGSIMSIHTAYYDAAQIAQVFPTVGGVSVSDALGPIDDDINYYGKTADAPDLRTVIKGVLDMWGQATFPVGVNPASFWATNPAIPPLIGFHGNDDDLLSINNANIKFAPNQSIQVGNQLINYTPYNSESQCLLISPYTLNQNATSIDLIGRGSKGIYDIFKSSTINKSVELYIDCQMKHGLDAEPQDAGDAPFQSDFGTGLATQDAVYRYIAQRAATFFQAVLTNQDINLVNDIWFECENKRVRSYVSTNPNNAPITTNNPAGCTITSCD